MNEQTVSVQQALITLGIPQAKSFDEVKEAYKKLAVQFHPDKNKDEGAEEEFKKCSLAFAVVAKYDREGGVLPLLNGNPRKAKIPSPDETAGAGVSSEENWFLSAILHVVPGLFQDGVGGSLGGMFKGILKEVGIDSTSVEGMLEALVEEVVSGTAAGAKQSVEHPVFYVTQRALDRYMKTSSNGSKPGFIYGRKDDEGLCTPMVQGMVDGKLLIEGKLYVITVDRPRVEV